MRPVQVPLSVIMTWKFQKSKQPIIDDAEKEVREIQKQYSSGLVTNTERYNKVIDIWSRTNEKVAKAMMERIATEEVL